MWKVLFLDLPHMGIVLSIKTLYILLFLVQQRQQHFEPLGLPRVNIRFQDLTTCAVSAEQPQFRTGKAKRHPRSEIWMVCLDVPNRHSYQTPKCQTRSQIGQNLMCRSHVKRTIIEG